MTFFLIMLAAEQAYNNNVLHLTVIIWSRYKASLKLTQQMDIITKNNAPIWFSMLNNLWNDVKC